MKPILYSHGETSFTNNGLGRLADCISCIVTEERNGIYECQFTYPVTGEMYSKIQIGCILGVIHDDAKDIQPFDIYAKDAPMNGVVTFYAHHISYRLGHVILKPFSASSITAVFAAIPNKTYNSCPFTFWTDKSVSATWKVEVPSAVKAILGGVDGSILDVYGKGEYEWDRFAVKLHLNRGNDNGVSIRYGVNLSDLDQSLDMSENYNSVAPYWMSVDGTLVTLPEGFITASSVQTGEEIIPVPLDLSSKFEDQPTVEQLRTETQRQLDNSEAWIPNENISVKFIDLAHTQEYKDIAALQHVRLCDKVSVYCGPLGVNVVKMQIIKTVYNVLLEEYDEIELGTAKTSFADTLMAKVSEATGDLPTSTEVKSMLRQAVDEATDQITGAQNSHVRFIYDANGSLQEIVILDTDDITTATKVWRWNSGGLGYSSNGYAGPYTLAMTQNGAIVADFITTGTLTAALIRAGVLQDVNGNNVWNLETGEFRLASNTTVGGSSVADIAKSKVDDLDNNLTQQEIFDRLTNNGAIQGIYLKNGLLYVNATYIDTGELSATLIKGGILKLGGSNNVNGILQIIDASGNVIGTWNNSGITINRGTIAGPSVTLGGNNNVSGILTVKDANGNTIGTWNNAGIQTKSLTADEYVYVDGGPNSYLSIPTYPNDGNHYFRISSAGITAHIDALYEVPGLSALEETILYIGRSNQYNTGVTASAIYAESTDRNIAYFTPGEIGLEYNKTRVVLSYDSIDVEKMNYNTLTFKGSWMTSSYIHTDGNAYVLGDATVSGTKSRVVSTDQYADRLLYCYETPTPMFGDIGEGVIADDGLCYVALDAIFAQTIATDQYQVFIQKYGHGDCWVKERNGAYFIIEGDPGLMFGWEIKAKQKDYDQLRLERTGKTIDIPEQKYAFDAALHIQNIRKERDEA